MGNYQGDPMTLTLPKAIAFYEDGKADFLTTDDSIRRVNWEWIDDVLYIDTLTWIVNSIDKTELRVQEDDLNHPKTPNNSSELMSLTELVFIKMKPSEYNYSSDNSKRWAIVPKLIGTMHTIKDNFWKLDKFPEDNNPLYSTETYLFEEGKQYLKRVYYIGQDSVYSEIEERCLQWEQLAEDVLWIESNRLDSCKGLYNNFTQINTVSETSFSTKTFFNKKVQNKVFRKVRDEFAIPDTTFRLCTDRYIPPFYRTELAYKGTKTAIKALFDKQNFGQYEKAGDNGYISIHFVVNCNGQIGRFSIKQMNLNFEPRTFQNKLLKALLETTLELKDWKVGKGKPLQTSKQKKKKQDNDNTESEEIEEEDQPLDSRIFLTFKIEDGILKEILP